jgi:hypothetical protein
VNAAGNGAMFIFPKAVLNQVGLNPVDATAATNFIQFGLQYYSAAFNPTTGRPFVSTTTEKASLTE